MKKFLFIVAMLFSTAGYTQIESATLTASGLTCSMCSKAIYKSLLKVSSIQKVDVDIEKSSYLITFKPGATVSPAVLKKAVEDAGFAVAELKLTASVPRTTVTADTRVMLQGSTYRLIRADGKTLQGTQTFTVVDKAYLLPAAYKRYAADLPSARENGVYYVTL